jgi:hypothetical protein
VTSLDVAVNGDQTVHDRQRLANMGDLMVACGDHWQWWPDN